ncbi:MAG: precorrin-3B C(17)-methyltransferase [Anaerovoracaceae bacterium]|jgi:precorrin-3B C17-methyltransferase
MNTVYAVGIGPGGKDYFTGEAMKALQNADVICGYTVYVDLVKDLFPDKEYFSTPMTHEIDRCRQAIETAQTGKNVAMVCSGDAGVYGMAGLLLELSEQYDGVAIEVVSGVTAALSGGAVLGAPIGHDFCVISLSDLLTPWELIEKRLRLAGEGDFAIAIYNPRSKKRSDYLDRACRILMESKSPDTVCGWVKNIGREGETSRVVKLRDLADEPVDMFTTVFIGTRTTREIAGKMVTPRGYERHEDRYFQRND